VISRATGAIMEGIPENFKLELHRFKSVRVSYDPDVPKDAGCPAAFLHIGLTSQGQFPGPDKYMVVGITVDPVFPTMRIFKRVGLAQAKFDSGSTAETVSQFLSLVWDSETRSQFVLVSRKTPLLPSLCALELFSCLGLMSGRSMKPTRRAVFLVMRANQP